MSVDITTMETIANELVRAGLRAGGVVLVHSSLSSLGWVPGGPETVICGLLQAIGEDGTLLLPAFSYDRVGWSNPYFDQLLTPSCVGAIPEYFRQRHGSIRSLNPTHSVCGVGRLADTICGDHQLDETPVGAHSPLRKVRDLNGQVLFLGCGLRPNTSMHGVEELARPPYLLREFINYQLTLADGTTSEMRCRHHDFRGWRQRYDRLEPYLEPGIELHVGRVLQAPVHIVEAQALWIKALAQYRVDPFAFVERIPASTL
jgi:aminoglycoside 3-N-acetyltransferase